MSSANLHITKLAAAERQLRAAIRLYFDGEDELAVHTVAAAAYQLLADLKAQRGLDDAADWYLTSFFYVVRDYRRGTLPRHLAESPEFVEWVAELAEKLPITAETEPNSVSVTISRRAAREYWDRRHKVANFLKHADRDARAALSLEEFDNFTLLMQAYCAYRDLVPDELGNEGLVLQAFIGAESPERGNLESPYSGLIQKFATVAESERKKLCSLIIRELNQT